MLSTCAKQPFLPHCPDKTIQEDLLWWLQKIITGAVIRPITTPITPLNPHAFLDASSGLGISIIIGSRWRAWRLRADWNTYRGKKDIGYAEAVGFELLIHATDALLDQPTDLILHGDNTGILDGWRIGRHRNHAVNAVFKSIHTFLESASHTLSIQPHYVASADNPTDPPSRGIYSPPPISSCLLWTSLSMLRTSSLTAPTPSQPASSESSKRADTQPSPHEPLTKCTPSSKRPSVPKLRPSSRTSSSSTFSKMIESVPSCFNFPLPFPNPSDSKSTTEHRPRPYPPNLRLLPSPNQPHCLAKDRLCLWIPTSPSTCTSIASSDVVSDIALNCILEVIGALWADSTKELYGTGLLIFHVHCDINNIPEIERCPISHPILLAFLSSCAGAYSGSAISNYAAGIHAWHLLHGHAWLVEPNELKLTLQGATCLAPHASKRPKRPPMTINDIKAIRAFLNLDDPCNTAIYACMVVVFYSVVRLGKFTVTAITKFDAAKHVTHRNISFLEDQRVTLDSGRGKHRLKDNEGTRDP